VWDAGFSCLAKCRAAGQKPKQEGWPIYQIRVVEARYGVGLHWQKRSFVKTQDSSGEKYSSDQSRHV